MPLSSNTLIHFTHSEGILRKIIDEGFKVKYCTESIDLDSKGSNLPIVVPMVSFCDIPMSQIKDHISKYGNYGVGLSKEWGIRTGLNPVLYLEKNSALSESIRESLISILKVNKVSAIETWVAATKQSFDVTRYLKNYENQLKRKDETIPDYRFYDEREWRYVPSYDDVKLMITSHVNYDTDEKKKALNKTIESIRVKFETSDINYIILKSESEIVPFTQWLRMNGSESMSDAAILKLTSRIITVDRIMNDF